VIPGQGILAGGALRSHNALSMWPLGAYGEALRQQEPAIDGVSAVVPVHDEEAAITDVVQALLDELPRVAARFEVIVVDDGSTDRTGTVLDRLAHSVSRLRIVRHARNRGYGAALRSGFATGTMGSSAIVPSVPRRGRAG
jgi:cellulose synthase/poly-beta-1,6-N-acetylglucosamine synthase-like glycosyltransferase